MSKCQPSLYLPEGAPGILPCPLTPSLAHINCGGWPLILKKPPPFLSSPLRTGFQGGKPGGHCQSSARSAPRGPCRCSLPCGRRATLALTSPHEGRGFTRAHTKRGDAPAQATPTSLEHQPGSQTQPTKHIFPPKPAPPLMLPFFFNGRNICPNLERVGLSSPTQKSSPSPSKSLP